MFKFKRIADPHTHTEREIYVDREMYKYMYFSFQKYNIAAEFNSFERIQVIPL